MRLDLVAEGGEVELRTAHESIAAVVDLRYLISIREASRAGSAAFTIFNCFKYLGLYLAADLRPELRRRAILFHHRFMAHKRPTVGWALEMPLWANQCDSGKIEIVARAAKLAPKEGEHEIAFKVEEQTVYSKPSVKAAAMLP